MLSSLNTFGGLSSAEISMLFGSNSPSSANSTPASSAQSAKAGIDATGANDPANAIHAILAQAEIAHRQLETSLGGSSSVVKAQTAYAERTEASGGEDISVTTAAAQTIQMGSSGTILDASDTMSGQYTEQGGINGFSYSTSYSVTSVLNAQGEETDYFQFAVGVGNDSITVGFSVDGLGPAAAASGSNGISVGQGDEGAEFQITAEDGSSVAGQTVIIEGLDAAQEQQVVDAFQKATSSTGDTNENFGAGFSVNFQTATYYSGASNSSSSSQTSA
jgi:hypothetical protein